MRAIVSAPFLLVLAGSLAITRAAPAQSSSPSSGGPPKEIIARPAGPPMATEAVTQAPAPPAPLKAVVRGLFIGTRVGGGYMVLRQKIEGDERVTVNGTDEGYGAGVMLQVELGYDLTDVFAVEAVGTASMVSGTHVERVRDLGLAMGGLALRVAPLLGERVRLVLAAGGGFASADNAVEAPESGPAAFFNAGIEYYVHVRHFSLGLDVSVLAPVKPLRLFVGVGPHVKYTF